MFIMRPDVDVNVITPRLEMPANEMILRLAVTDVKLIYEDVNMREQPEVFVCVFRRFLRLHS